MTVVGQYQQTGQQQQQQYQQAGQQQQQQYHQPGHNGGAKQQQRVLQGDLQHEREHMKEHMDVPIDTSQMSEQELQFHYFKMHDTDGNNKLDGCELVKSLIHWHDKDNHKAGTSSPPPRIFQDEDLSSVIDPIMETDDRNRDGFIDYAEFVAAR